MSEKRKKYDREFGEGAVRIVEETNRPVAQGARGCSSRRRPALGAFRSTSRRPGPSRSPGC